MNKSFFSPLAIIVGILVILALGGAGLYFYKSSSTTPKTTYRIAGSGSAAIALKNWATRYEKQNPQVRLEFVPSADAAIAFRGVEEKIIDIGVSSRLPKKEEENPVLVVTPFATDAIVLAVNSSVTDVSSLSKAQIISIWSGVIANWKQVGGPDARIVLIDREEAESSKKKLRDLYLGETKVAPDAIEVHSEDEVSKAVGSTQFSIGILSYGRLKTNTNLVALKLDGVGVDGVASGSYSFVRKFSVVTRKDSPDGVNDFVRFLEASNAQELYREFNYYSP